MNPMLTELEKLTTAVKKELRAFKHVSAIPDGPVPPHLLEKARQIGLPIDAGLTLQEMLRKTLDRIQTELLSEYQRSATNYSAPTGAVPPRKDSGQ